jgi:hypothetical protein
MLGIMQHLKHMLIATAVAGASSASAQTSYPMIMSVSPVAAQTGQTSEHTLESRYSLFGAYRVLVSGAGVTGEVSTKMELDKNGKEPALTKIQLKFAVTEDALPGVRDFRVIGPTGASTLGQIVVTKDPVQTEAPKNDTAATAQKITLPGNVCGTVEKAEDVDFYRFKVEQTTTLTFHCQAMRLQDKIHDLQTHVDPIITIRDAQTNSTLASVDNSYAADPFLAHEFQPGEYLLEVRDVRYSGNRYWNYSIDINDRPFVSHVYPSAVAKGQTANLQLVGSHLQVVGTVAWQAPADFEQFTIDVSLPIESGLSNPVAVVLSDLPVAVETEDENNTADGAQTVSFPGAVSGRIESEADIDCYSFEAKKGDKVSIEVKARRNRSGLDSIIRILNADGKRLTENDDLRLWNKMTVQDSQIENWTVPADGTYVVEIRDVHLRGGDEFVYLLELTQAQPYFELVMDSDKSWLTPGTSAALFVRCVRRNGFDGQIQLHVDGLADGLTATCGRILPGKGADGCIILEAATDAIMSASNIHVWGTASLPVSSSEETDAAAGAVVARTELTAHAQPMQETYMPGGGRSHWPVAMHTVAVGKPADILDVKLSTQAVSLKPGDSVKVDVEVVRSEGFDKNVTLDMLFQHLSSKYAITLPEGVTVDTKNSVTLLTGKTSKGAITLTAAATAPAVERQQCCIMANVSINFVMKATYSSQPLFVSVVAP